MVSSCELESVGRFITRVYGETQSEILLADTEPASLNYMRAC